MTDPRPADPEAKPEPEPAPQWFVVACCVVLALVAGIPAMWCLVHGYRWALR